MVRAGWRPRPRRLAEAHHVSRHALTLRAAPSRRDGLRPYSASGATVAPPGMAGKPGAGDSLALQSVVPACPTGKHRQPPDGSALVRASTAGSPRHDSPRPTRIEPEPDVRHGPCCAALPAVDALLDALGGRIACGCGRYRRRSPPAAQRPQRLRRCAGAGDTWPCAGLPANDGRTLNRVALIGFAASGSLPFRIGLVALR
jgi:hypothetical protein